jgi:hypothetical protein
MKRRTAAVLFLIGLAAAFALGGWIVTAGTLTGLAIAIATN